MIKIVTLVRCKCDNCESTVNELDKFCSECGWNLKTEITYEELKGNKR